MSNYNPHGFVEYGDCHVVQDESTDFSTSIAVLLIALAASEVVILGLCKALAWYSDVIFYSQDWARVDYAKLSQERSQETIARSLETFSYNRRLCDVSAEETCPICLVEFGEYILSFSLGF